MAYFDETTLAEVQSGLLEQVFLAKVSFADGASGYWTGPGNITFDGVAYLGDGSLGKIDGFSDAEGLSSSEGTVVLNGAIASVHSAFKTRSWHLRRIEVFGLLYYASRRAFYPTKPWREVGLIEVATINQATGDEASITLRVCDLNQLSKIGSAGYLTDGDQRRRLETDSILRNVSALGRSTTNSWGKKMYQYGNQVVHGKSING
jgi:hypothetical protein